MFSKNKDSKARRDMPANGTGQPANGTGQPANGAGQPTNGNQPTNRRADTERKARRAKRRELRRLRRQDAKMRTGGGELHGHKWWITLIVVPIAVLSLIFSTYILSGYMWSRSAGSDYRAGHLQQAEESYRFQQRYYGWIEPWRTPFNVGTTLAKQQKYPAAEKHLRKALANVPHAYRDANGFIDATSEECVVRLNLSVVLEKQADALGKSSPQARSLYKDAARLSSPCALTQQIKPSYDEQEPMTPEEKKKYDKARDTHKRQQEKADKSSQKKKKNQGDTSKEPSRNHPDDQQRAEERREHERAHEEDKAEKQRERELEQRKQDAKNGKNGQSGDKGFQGKPW